jgi:ERF superfamily protein
VSAEDEAMPGHRSIFELWAEVKREIGPVGKDSYNKQQGFNFRGIDAVVNAAAPALDKHGVIIIPQLRKTEYVTVETGQKRTLMGHVRLEVAYLITGPRGDHLPEIVVPGEAMDSGDKATPKAMSVAYRIALLQALNLPTGDPDPDESSYERSPRSAGDAWDSAAAAPAPANTEQLKAKIAAVATTAGAEALFTELRALRNSGKLSDEQAMDLKNLLDARVEEIRAQAREAREQQPAAGAAGRPGDDADWVAAFRKSLAGAEKPEDLDGKRGEVGRAIIENRVTAETGNQLVKEWSARKAELEQPAREEVPAA